MEEIECWGIGALNNQFFSLIFYFVHCLFGFEPSLLRNIYTESIKRIFLKLCGMLPGKEFPSQPAGKPHEQHKFLRSYLFYNFPH